MHSTPILDFARSYVAAGISVIPVAADGTKAPATQLLPAGPDGRRGWGQFRERLPTVDELEAWFGSWGRAQGIGVVNGKISGGLEVIDFDNIKLVTPWADRVVQLAPGLGPKLVIVQSPRPGIHVYYRTEHPLHSGKLARHLAKQEDGTLAPKTLIEIKGEGGYTIAPPSGGGVHPSGRPYAYWGTRDLTEVQLLTNQERDVLLEAARQFDEIPPTPKAPRRHPTSIATGTRPGDLFNARANWPDILEPHGWAYVNSSEGIEHWRRPGKTTGTSATVNYADAGLLHVFSENATPFEAGISYTKFSAFTLLNHDGDFKAAAQALRQMGYATQLAAGRRSVRPLRHAVTVSVPIPGPTSSRSGGT